MCISLGTDIIIIIKLPRAINTPAIFPMGSDTSNRVSATALRAYASMHIIIERGKKIIYSFTGFQRKLVKKFLIDPTSPLIPPLPLNTYHIIAIKLPNTARTPIK